MNKIGIIGDKESVLCFMAAGFTVFIAETPEQAAQKISHAAKNGFAVLYVTEDLLSQIPDVYDRYKTDPSLAVVPLPPRTGSNGFGMASIRKSVERAVGADILQ